MKLDVPYQSQIPLETTEDKRWCGLASLSMVIGYYLKDSAPPAQELVEKYAQDLEESGFTHQFLINIARDYNLRGFRKSWWASPGDQTLIEKFRAEGENDQDIKDWSDTNLEEGIFTIKSSIEKNCPVIVSVSPEFSPSNSTHLIVLVGYEDDNLIIHDPYKKGEGYKISEDEFKKFWLKQAIFIRPL